MEKERKEGREKTETGGSDQIEMKDAGKKERLYAFEEIVKKGYWETEESMLPVDDPVKRERLQEMLKRVRVKCGILV